MSIKIAIEMSGANCQSPSAEKKLIWKINANSTEMKERLRDPDNIMITAEQENCSDKPGAFIRLFPNWRNSVQIATLQSVGHILLITNLNTLQSHLQK